MPKVIQKLSEKIYSGVYPKQPKELDFDFAALLQYLEEVC